LKNLSVARRLVGDIGGMMDTILDVVQLSVAFTIFIVFFPMLLSLASMVTGMAKGVGQVGVQRKQ